ncbi:putative leucine-rich repeat receptor-like serine/threonine-protein kinase At2g24130 [Lolium rigidum]|uniref:putative leucine-rich repeat receptor-like serine/threonine-protein kinase At2g24130 n=1 Tax=Lolium rigidum TaxID=89674 RepID=UPI001F5D6E13|nr:putative leucine-rich repeat receptor-like serine/threonine-protein kinase At2g24130 [Lolium rigidum]
MVHIFKFLVFLLLCSVARVGGVSEEDDRSVLLGFKAGVTGDPMGALAGWGSPDVCNWTGVACDVVTHRVVNLTLSNLNLSGKVSPTLGNLWHLRKLDLSRNHFAGSVPPELGNLSRLSCLDLSENLFVGTVPPQLGKLTQLEILSLSENQLEGSIPGELARIRSLECLNLGENNLSGHIPAAIFCNHSALYYFDVSYNSLDGEIPIRVDCPLSNLEMLVVWSNKLNGSIPRSLSNSTKLRWLLLQDNFLTGELPSDDMFSGMESLEFLHLSFNFFTSQRNTTSLEPFFASLANCTGLVELSVAGNDLVGTIPPVIGRLSPSLMHLHLQFNKIFGPIPANLSYLANLTDLNLSGNLLNGSIPRGIAGMRKLELLNLSNNLLSGEIPPSLGTIPRLGLVDFSHNWLTGAIPQTIVQCMTMQTLDLSHNMLGGEIPAGLSRLSGLLYLNLSSNLLCGAIPVTIGKMVKLEVINLSSNRLSGTIPPQLGHCVELQYLDVSYNGLRPRSVSPNPPGLTGTLPLSMEKMLSLRRVNFSYNDFWGEVPSGGKFAGFPADAFLGNADLCTERASMMPGLAKCSRRKHSALHNRRVVLPVVFTIASFTTAIIVLAMCRSMGRDGRRSALLAYVGGGEPSNRGDHPRISQRELSEATGGFEQSRLIGAGRFGRVYGGTLRDGTRVAVKVLDPITRGEVSWSFKRECDVLRWTRHRNLVRVITTCSQPDFHALVLPWMTNGSLESRLYPSDGGLDHGMDLTWLVAIASNIAEGLTYLHHYAPVRIIHCDLKPGNVLLDDDMTAVVADFGIARLVKDMGDDDITGFADPCNSIAGLLQGSVGYIAPEYGLGGHPSTEGDVYSFGVMLLEMITGKRPTDALFQEGLTLHEWVRRHHPHDVAAIIAQSWLAAMDAMLSAVQAGHIVVELIDLGIACTQYSPVERPTMAEVCHSIALLKVASSRRVVMDSTAIA